MKNEQGFAGELPVTESDVSGLKSVNITDEDGENACAVAIVGMSGRFPGAGDVESLWHLMVDGREGLRRFTRQELEDAGVSPTLLDDPDFVPVRGVVDDADRFEAELFGYSPREAALLDPQQRLFLESAWAALEVAGYDSQRFSGSIGVYGCSGLPRYLLQNLAPKGDLLAAEDGYQIMISNDKDFLASRVSYKLGLRGPSMTVQTACSSSLVAVSEACLGLLSEQCDIALAGGVSLTLPLVGGHVYREGSIFSPDGCCRPFDAAAKGTVAGSGVGVVALKRLADACRDGDHIYAVISGFGVNNDGSDKAGYTAPSIEGQAEVLSMARAMAGVHADDIGYIEAHGTATPLGDPIELEALTLSFREQTHRRGYCGLGSIKSNVGHLDVASGVVGLIKAALCVERGVLPATLHFDRPNPHLNLEQSPFFVSSRTRPWPSGGKPRIAGVSSFGIGGTNAHVIVREPPERSAGAPSRRWQLLPVSAHRAEAKEELVKRLVRYIDSRPDVSLSDVAYTLSRGRRQLKYRDTLVVEDIDGRPSICVTSAGYGRVLGTTPERPPGVAFMFTGQGSQHIDMGRGLYRDEPVFRQAFDMCARQLEPLLGRDIRDVVFSGRHSNPDATDLAQTSLAQPVIFVVEYALAQLWDSIGIRPNVMIGHSLGEFTAACLAGVFSLEQTLQLLVRRGQLMQSTSPGVMMAVALSESEVRERLPDGVEIAAINTPTRTVVTGCHRSMTAFESDLTHAGVPCRRLATSHAMHSWMMEPVLQAFGQAVKSVGPRPPERPIISAMNGRLLSDADATDPRYWALQLRNPVRFADGLAACRAQGASVFVEVGPGTTLSTFARETFRGVEDVVSAASMRHPRQSLAESQAWLRGVGRVWAAGVDVDFSRLHGDGCRRIPLPTYPFRGARHWIDPRPSSDTPVNAQPRPVCQLFAPQWGRVEAFGDADLRGQRWLLLDDGALSELGEHARARGVEIVALTSDEAVRGLREAFVMAPVDRVIYGLALTEATSQDAVLQLIEVLEALPGRTPPLCMDLVTRGGHRLPGDRTSDPRQALITGLCRVIDQEYPHVVVRGVDLPLHACDALNLYGDTFVTQLAGLRNEHTPYALAWRDGHLWARGFGEMQLPPQENPIFEQRGVYLITGGFGGIGDCIARHLAKHYSARLILASRTADLPPRESWSSWLRENPGKSPVRQRIETCLDLERAGGEVFAIQVDVGELSAVEAMMSAITTRFGRLDGVFHAAGIFRPRRLVDVDRDHVQSVFHSKVRGTDHLFAGIATLCPRFLWLMSSLSTVLGGTGLGAYAAANAYLEAIARNCVGSETRVLSIAWEGWSGVGMATDPQLPPWYRSIASAFSAYWIHPDDGMELVDRLARARLAGEVVVTARPLGEILDPRIGSSTADRRNGDEVVEVVCATFGEVLGIANVLPDQDFFDLGGHSLMALQVASRLRRTLGVSVTGHALLEHPTPAALAVYLRTEQGVDSNRETNEPALVVELQRGEPGVAPVFFLHPVGGTIFQYRPLARGLPTRVPVYGIRALGCESGEVVDDDVQVMARRYIDAARSVYGGKRWRLGGYSFGGVLAWEMAQQLQASGDAVELLVLADTPGPQEAPVELNERRTIEDYLQEVGRGFLQQLSCGESSEASEQRMHRFFELFQLHCQAMRRYQARPYTGCRVVYFRARSRDRFNVARPEMTWVDLATQGIEVHLVPGNHITMARAPEVRAQVELLREHLDRLDGLAT